MCLHRHSVERWVIFGEHGRVVSRERRSARQIILTYAKPGGIILGPFSGSGTTCLVAQSLGYDFIGFEIVQRYAEYANHRLMTDKRFARPTVNK